MFPNIILYLLICRFAPEFRQIKVLQGEIYLYVCCLGRFIPFVVPADHSNIIGLRNTFSLRAVSVDISLGKLNNSLDVVFVN